MNILSYSDRFSSLWLDDLLQKMQEEGDFEGGLREAEARERIAAILQDWDRLFAASAGQRVTEEVMNAPARILLSRIRGLEADASSFYQRMRLLLQKMQDETRHLDSMLSRLESESWRVRQPALPFLKAAVLQDLGAGLGVTAGEHAPDPATGRKHWIAAGVPALPQRVSVADGAGVLQGLATARQTEASIRPISRSWSVGEQESAVIAREELDGEVCLLQVLARPDEMTVSDQEPSVRVLAPSSRSGLLVAAAAGQHRLGALPVYVRIQFRPRRAKKILAVPDSSVQEKILLSDYRISRDDFFVLSGDVSYQPGVDYVLLEEERALEPAPSMAGKTVEIRFTEFWPAYQCSLNNEDWSSPVFLDPEAPFPPGHPAPPAFALRQDPDGTVWFPVLDESNSPVGSYFRMLEFVDSEYLLRVSAAGGGNQQMKATLEVLFDRAAHVNWLRLDPLCSYPMLLDRIDGEGLVVGQAAPVFTGPLLIDRPVDVPLRDGSSGWPYVRRLFLHLRQPTYKVKHHELYQEREIRAEAWARISAIMPRQFRRRPAVQPRRLSGFQYEFGFASIEAVRKKGFSRGVLVFGPYNIPAGCRYLRLDADVRPDPQSSLPVYQQVLWYGRLEYIGMDGRPQMAYPESQDTEVNPAQTLRFIDVWPSWTEQAGLPAKIYLVCVLQAEEAVLKRFYLQVA